MFLTKEDLNNTQKFKPYERLKSKKNITSLFNKKEGSFFVCKPLKVVFLIESNKKHSLPKVGFTVPKSKFRLAVNRNSLKRKLKNSYRLNKTIIINKSKLSNKNYSLMFVYSNNKTLHYSQIDKAMITLLNKF